MSTPTASGYTLFNVPYLSMPAELATKTHVRTRMMAHRSAFIAGGTFFGVAFAPYLVGAMGGGQAGYFVATTAYALVTLSWLLAEHTEPMSLVMVRAMAFGIISGGMLLMGNAMLQDVMDQDFRATGKRKNGLFAGMYSLTEKITFGIGAQILGLVLSTTGFSRAAAVQSESAIQGIYITVALIPAILMLISLLAIYLYRLDESELT